MALDVPETAKNCTTDGTTPILNPVLVSSSTEKVKNM